MNAATAAKGSMTPAELAQWVAKLRAAQGLPPKVENPSTLQHIADLMRSHQQVRRRST